MLGLKAKGKTGQEFHIVLQSLNCWLLNIWKIGPLHFGADMSSIEKNLAFSIFQLSSFESQCLPHSCIEKHILYINKIFINLNTLKLGMDEQDNQEL